MEFDTEKFIIEIQNRPSIWNTRSSEYSDKNLKQRQWEEIVNIYSSDELSTEEKKKLGQNLQKKWRNIRDCFVKAHKAKQITSGSAAKKKITYVFYDNLLFIKDTVTVNTITSNITVKDEGCEDVNEVAPNVTAQSSLWPPKRNKKNKHEDDIGRQLIGALNRNLEKKCFDDDEDRLFFLSMVNEFKKIPDHLRMQTKLDLLNVIKDAQFSDYPDTSWGYARPQYRGCQTAYQSSNHQYTVTPIESSEVLGLSSGSRQEATVSPSESPGLQSPTSMDSTTTQDS